MTCPDCDCEMHETNRLNAYDRWTRDGLEQDEYPVYECKDCGIEMDTREAELDRLEEAKERAAELKADRLREDRGWRDDDEPNTWEDD